MPIIRDLPPLPGYHPEIGLLLADLQDSTQNGRMELGTVGTEALRWQPYPGGPSIGMLILHLADCEAYWFETVGAGRPRSKEEADLCLSEQTNQYGPSWPACPRKPLSYFYGIQDQVRA